MSMGGEEHCEGSSNFFCGVWTRKDLGLGAPCLLYPLCALIEGVQTSGPCHTGVGAEDRWRDLSVPSLGVGSGRH